MRDVSQKNTDVDWNCCLLNLIVVIDLNYTYCWQRSW